ncbi:MAG: Crp/Fnr family transcriptional regulator [Bacteroidales bacterium]|nr:Crp/Fnr family transcriptional regulator [Bacteroidales bacterium]
MPRKTINEKDILPHLTTILSLLSDEQRELLIQRMTIHVLKKNEVIYSEGEPSSFMYCLVSGKVKVQKAGVGGRSQIVRVIKPVEYFGYRPAFAGQSHATEALAFEPSVIVRFPIHTIITFLQVNPRLGWFFIEHLSRHLGRADERTVNLTQKHIRGRLAESLLFLRESYGLEEDESTLSIYLSREDLANLSNMTTSNAIRTLSTFAQEKLIAIDGKKIKILDVEKLEKISRIG